jgi:peptide/nickel transport system substrate-binding protein
MTRLMAAAAALALCLSIAACGSSRKVAATGGAAGSSDVLRIPYLADMSVPDPDVFYDVEGNSVILNQYQGLLKYAPDSTKIVGNLAKAWTVSPDRLTYTFRLRDGVTFHDGTAMTSTSVKASFQRRVDVGQAPSYMLADVAKMTTPDPLTFVVRLSKRVDPFESYMASSWGPKIIGPDAITTHAGKDFGQTYLRTHGDGTGPFKLTTFERGRQYVLTRNDSYWGAKPFFREVRIKITPDIGSQRLQVVNGDLDAVTHSFPASELASLPSSLKVLREDSFLQLMLYVNTNRQPFGDPAVRRGLRATIDIPALVSQAYSGTATPAAGPYPAQLLSGQPALPYAPDPVAAKAAAAKASTKKITLAYTSDESGVQRRVSELLDASLTAAGYDVSLKEVQLPQVYGYVKHLDKAPDLLLSTNTPDGAHPDLWARILFSSKGGLNFLGFSDPKLDGLLDEALGADQAKADALYRQVGQRFVDGDGLFFLGAVKDVLVLRKDLTGIEHVLAYPWTIDYAALKRGGA